MTNLIRLIKINHADYTIHHYLSKPKTREEVSRFFNERLPLRAAKSPKKLFGRPTPLDWTFFYDYRQMLKGSISGCKEMTTSTMPTDGLVCGPIRWRHVKSSGGGEYDSGGLHVHRGHPEEKTNIPRDLILNVWACVFTAEGLGGKTVLLENRDEEETYTHELWKISRDGAHTRIASYPSVLEEKRKCLACSKFLKKGQEFWRADLIDNKANVLKSFAFCSYKCEREYEF